jgi:hypothetical protein
VTRLTRVTRACQLVDLKGKQTRERKIKIDSIQFNSIHLTLYPPALKTQCLSQCQTFQRLVRSSQKVLTLFLISFVCFLIPEGYASVCNLSTSGQ